MKKGVPKIQSDGGDRGNSKGDMLQEGRKIK